MVPKGLAAAFVLVPPTSAEAVFLRPSREKKLLPRVGGSRRRNKQARLAVDLPLPLSLVAAAAAATAAGGNERVSSTESHILGKGGAVKTELAMSCNVGFSQAEGASKTYTRRCHAEDVGVECIEFQEAFWRKFCRSRKRAREFFENVCRGREFACFLSNSRGRPLGDGTAVLPRC